MAKAPLTFGDAVILAKKGFAANRAMPVEAKAFGIVIDGIIERLEELEAKPKAATKKKSSTKETEDSGPPVADSIPAEPPLPPGGPSLQFSLNDVIDSQDAE